MNRVYSSRESEAVRRMASNWIARRDAGLTAAEQSELESWRDADPAHAAAFARYDRLWSKLDRPRAAGAAPELQRDLGLLAVRARRRRANWSGAAALAIAIFAGGWWAWRPYADQPHAVRDAPVVIVPERRALTDGTVIEYPVGSAIAVDFSSPKLRRVTVLRGEAHFAVAKNPARPFVVRAAGIDVQAVGTAFSVQLAPSAVEVLVTEGRVAVNQSAAGPGSSSPSTSNSTLLDAGQKLSVAMGPTPNSSLPQVEAASPAEIEQRLGWRNPRMEFSKMPLHEVVAAINRYALERGGVQFTLHDPSLGEKRLSGIFRIDDESAFIAILEKGFGIEAERIGQQMIVLRAGR